MDTYVIITVTFFAFVILATLSEVVGSVIGNKQLDKYSEATVGALIVTWLVFTVFWFLISMWMEYLNV